MLARRAQHGRLLLFKDCSAAWIRPMSSSVRDSVASAGEAAGERALNQSKKKRWAWKNESDLREFLDSLKERYDIRTDEDWGRVTAKMVRACGGGGLFQAYGSLYAALDSAAYPVHTAPVRGRRWDTREKRKAFLDDVARRLELADPLDWRSVRKHQVDALGGAALLRRCGGLEPALRDAYGDEVTVRSKERALWESSVYRREFMAALGESLRFSTPEDWATLSRKQVVDFGGAPLLQYHKGSVVKAIKETIGEERWTAMRESRPRRTWACQESVRAFMEALGKKIGASTPEQWLSVKTSTLKSNRGGRLLARYRWNLREILSVAFPEIDWDDVVAPQFKSRDARRALVLDLGKRRGITTPAQWLSLTKEDFIAADAGEVLRAHGGIYGALRELLPEVDFSTVASENVKKPKSYWNDTRNVRAFMDTIAKRNDITTTDDWKRVSARDLIDAGGLGLLTSYGRRMIDVLKAAYPEREWNAWESRRVLPRGYWDDREEQRRFLAEFAEANGIQKEEDWAVVSLQDIAEAGGQGLVRRLAPHNVYALLSQVFPEKKFDQLYVTIGTVPASYWSEEIVTECMEFLREELSVERKEEWARVSQNDVVRASKASGRFVHKILHHFSLAEALRMAYPEEDWGFLDTATAGIPLKKSSQRSLRLSVQKLFPQADVLEDHLHQLQRLSGRPVELDVFVPSHSLAFEYQGEQHYHETPAFSSLEAVRHRDEEKRRLCRAEGIRLVEVPYWWDFSLPSLAATVHTQYPSLLREAASDIVVR